MDTIALILSIIGSLNWGLVGIFQFDLVAWLFGGQDAVISRIIYTLVGPFEFEQTNHFPLIPERVLFHKQIQAILGQEHCALPLHNQ